MTGLRRVTIEVAGICGATGASTRIFLLLPAMLNAAPPPATRDLPPEEAALRRRLESSFMRTAEAYGFEEIATPMFERAELFAARSGAEIESSLLTFHCDHEEYALRPEMTAPACRLAASGALAGRPAPHKLFYVAPCFRYCRPHAGRYREFTQAGLECIGAAGAEADAEIIAAACRFLRAAGAADFSLKIGTVGVFRELLTPGLNADERAAVIGRLDRLIDIDERCAAAAAGGGRGLFERLRSDRRDFAAMQAGSGYRGEYAIAERPALDGRELAARFPREAAAALRHAWSVEGRLDERTAELLLRAARIRGAADEVAAQAAALLPAGGACGALDDLLAVCALLEAYGAPRPEAALGIARGLTFYTGVVFEISANGRKYCGGGRYDNMMELFGGERMPSTGCAFRFDALFDVAAAGGGAPPPGLALEPASAADRVRTIGLAEALRDRGLRVGARGAPKAVVSGGRARLADGSEVAAEAEELRRACGAAVESGK